MRRLRPLPPPLLPSAPGRVIPAALWQRTDTVRAEIIDLYGKRHRAQVIDLVRDSDE